MVVHLYQFFIQARCGPLVERIEKGDKERTRVQLVDDLSNELCIAADLVCELITVDGINPYFIG